MQIPLTDLKKIRLVNRTWGNTAASIQFYTFESDLAETDMCNLQYLLTSPFRGFLDNIRVLKITKAGDSANAREEQSHNVLWLATTACRDCASIHISIKVRCGYSYR